MYLKNALPAAALLAPQALAQAVDPTSTYFAPGIPTDTPVPGNYTDYLRPRVHYSPPRYFMNDPNGMHRDAEGTWHLYYQYNPLTPVAGNQVRDTIGGYDRLANVLLSIGAMLRQKISTLGRTRRLLCSHRTITLSVT